MKIIIKETNETKMLSIIDPKTGLDWISDFVGNTGATSDGQFEWNDDLDAYVCDKYTYEWWEKLTTSAQKAGNRLYEIRIASGDNAANEIIEDASVYNDLDDFYNQINNVIDAIEEKAGLEA